MKRVLALVLLFSAAQLMFAQAKPLTVDSIFADGSITGRAPETVKWSPDGTKVSFVQRDDAGEHGALWFVDVASGNKAELVTEEKLATLQPPIGNIKDEREKERLARYSVAGYHWAPDSKHLLFISHGQLWYYSLDTRAAVQLTSSPDPASDPKFSPDGKLVSYVREHNLYVRPVDGGAEKQLTKDGAVDLLNGEVDWLYAEELDVRSNYFWSPDGKEIVFLQMNEKPVPTYPITDWIPTRADVDQMKYPKAGDRNPEVKLGVVDVSGGKVRWLLESAIVKDVYIPRFGFVRPGVVWAQTLNRAQTELNLHFADTRSGKSQVMLSEKERDAWVEVNDGLKFLLSGDTFTWLSWRDGFTGIYVYSFDKQNPLSGPAKLERKLTNDKADVFDIAGIDDNTVYFTSNREDARQRQLYAVPLAGGEVRKISREPGTHAATFPQNGAKHYVDNYSAVVTGPTLSLCQPGGACNPIWTARSVDEYELLAPKFLELKAADGKTILYASLLMPPNASGKVPVILNPYGGPGGQVVRDSWGGSNALFDQLLARRGFAVLKIDNRGMAARGKAFVAATRRKMGEIETQDQLAALDQVLAQFPQLDANRVGFWGWSYGGYMTLYVMTHSDRIKAGVSVAPVTDWRNYDSTYTERYMSTPDENPTGYSKSSPVNAAKDMNGRVLIVHGTSDDNVHVQNTIQMANRLVEANKPFDLQLYPRKTHGIAGKAARTHLFNRIMEHFVTHLMNAEASSSAAN